MKRTSSLVGHWLRLGAIALALLLPPVAAAATPPGLRPALSLPPSWRVYSDPFFHALFRDVDDAPIGIPSAITRDGRGFVWVGYLEGLARWDGAEFKTYGAEAAGRGAALPEPSVSSLHTDRAGDLWVGMHSRGLVRYDAARDAFVRASGPVALDHGAIGDIVDASDRGLWVASSLGLAHIDPATFKVRLDRTGPLSRGLEHVAVSPTGVLWASRGGELLRRAPDGGWSVIAASARGGGSPIIGLAVDESRRVWVVERDGVIAVLDDAGEPVRKLQAPGDASLALGAAPVLHNGRIWIGGTEGLYAIDTATFAVRTVRHDAMRSSSLPQDNVTAIHIDASGLLWSGSDAAMSFADLDPRQAFGLSSAFASRSSDAHSTPSVLREAPDGALWLGQLNAPLQKLDPRTGQATAVQARGAIPEPRSVVTLAFTPDGRLLAGARNGLFELGPDGVVKRRLTVTPMRRLLVDGDDLYVGDTEGLRRTDVAGVGPITLLPSVPNGPGQSVNALARTAPGRIWVGGFHGLYRFDARTQGAVRVAGGGLDTQYLTTLHTDGEGRLWVGTIGGLFLISDPDSPHAHIRRFGLTEGLPNPNIDGILEAQDGGIWVSTDKGIARIDPKTFAMRRLSEAEGVAFANNWADGADRLANGELVFAGVGGLTFVDPRFPVDAPPVAVMVTDVRVGDRIVSPTTTRVDIQPGAGPLSVSFASPDLAASDRIGFAYRLKGLDKAWTRVAPHRRTVEFSHLPPGSYTLEVQATDRQGVLSGAPHSIDVVAHPSLTQSWAFRAGLCLIALAVAAGGLALRHRAQKLRQAHLESLVERRTAELRCSQAELERLAYFDPLTGLANRRMFQELLTGLMKPGHSQPFALIVGDLDRFKSINDSLGHDAGDELLSQVAARLASTVRARDSVCRLGGDEFALLVQDLHTPEEIAALCERLLRALEEPVFFQGRAMHTGLSLGVALFPADAASAVELYKLADTALYAAKGAGRGTWRMVDARASSVAAE